MNKRQRKKFLQEIKADVRQYTENIGADSKTKANFDAHMLSKDWQRVGDDIRYSIRINDRVSERTRKILKMAEEEVRQNEMQREAEKLEQNEK